MIKKGKSYCQKKKLLIKKHENSKFVKGCLLNYGCHGNKKLREQ